MVGWRRTGRRSQGANERCVAEPHERVATPRAARWTSHATARVPDHPAPKGGAPALLSSPGLRAKTASRRPVSKPVRASPARRLGAFADRVQRLPGVSGPEAGCPGIRGPRRSRCGPSHTIPDVGPESVVGSVLPDFQRSGSRVGGVLRGGRRLQWPLRGPCVSGGVATPGDRQNTTSPPPVAVQCSTANARSS